MCLTCRVTTASDSPLPTTAKALRALLLAERTRDAAVAKTALSQISTAFETMRDGGHAPYAAYYEQQLPTARALVTRLRGQ